MYVTEIPSISNSTLGYASLLVLLKLSLTTLIDSFGTKENVLEDVGASDKLCDLFSTKVFITVFN